MNKTENMFDYDSNNDFIQFYASAQGMTLVLGAFQLLILLCVLLLPSFVRAETENQVLNPESFRHYVDRFNAEDEENVRQAFPNEMAWSFFCENVPLLDFPDADVERTWYFRWWTFRKAIKRTAEGGFIVTEFLPPVPWAGKENAISCPAGHHFREGRWLGNRTFLEDYARFWVFGGGASRLYSFWLADSVWQQALATGDTELAVELLDGMIANYEAWESDHLDPNGLFWQTDNRDGMEVSVGGSGYRATINSYLYADALAIARIAEIAGKPDIQQAFQARADRLKTLINEKLWDSKAQFFKVAPRVQSADEPLVLQDVREEHGFTPWYPDEGRLPRAEYSVAWAQLMDPDGFYAPFGPTTTEQRHPGFQLNYEGHECQWNGPSWPYSTTITLTALANLVNREAQTGEDFEAHRQAFVETLSIYARCHQRTREDGKVVCWIDENLNPFNGDWISRTRLKEWGWKPQKGGRERGKDYNHSAFCDLVILGLVGVRPTLEDGLRLFPLADRNIPYFCLDRLPYHGKRLTILWDSDGKRYGRGTGLRVLADGKEIFHSESLPDRPVWIGF